MKKLEKSANSTSSLFLKKQKREPGLYFDADQGYTQKQQQIMDSHSMAKGNMPLSERSQKLYSPYEYLHYATKINSSKESYINALQQLGLKQAPMLHEKPLNDIMNKTQNKFFQKIIKNSYSIKYIGVIEGNMGILSKRMKINQQNNDIQSQYSKSHVSNFTQSKQKSQSVHSQGITPLSPKFFNNSNQNTNENEQFPQPEMYNNYIIGKYSLPNNLKTLHKKKDNEAERDYKNKLEMWHADKIKGITHSNFAENYISSSQQYMTNVVNSKRQQRKQISSMNTKRQIQNYEENVDEGICYAIIERPKEKQIISYSRLLNQMSEKQNSGKKYNSRLLQNNIEYSQNERIYDRYAKLGQGK